MSFCVRMPGHKSYPNLPRSKWVIEKFRSKKYKWCDDEACYRKYRRSANEDLVVSPSEDGSEESPWGCSQD